MIDQTQRLPPRTSVGFELLESDPRRLGDITILRRLKPGHVTLTSSPKPLAYFGIAPPHVPGSQPELLTVKIAREPLTDVSARCLREEEIWARAEQVFHSVGEGASHQWVARRYLQGTPLHELGQEVGPDVRRQYAEFLLAEIERFHAAGEAHLDVKPSNTIVTLTRAWLIDFESSRTVDQTATGPLLTTLNFASPEQVAFRPERSVGTAADIFSWGLTVVALFRPDYHPYCGGPFRLELIQQLDAQPAEARSAERLDLDAIPDPTLRAAVRRALAWDAADRPTAAELRQQLQQQPVTVVMAMPFTQVLPADYAVTEPWWRTATRYVGPGGPLGDKRVPLLVTLTAYLAGGAVSIGLGLMLAGLIRGVFG